MAGYIAASMDLNRFRPIPILVHHAVQVYELPPGIQNPVDRLMVAQNRLESHLLLMRDEENLGCNLGTI